MDQAWRKGSDNPGAWLIQPDGMVDYNAWLGSRPKQESELGLEAEDMSAPHAEALMQDVESNSQLGMGSLEFAGDLSQNEPNLNFLPYSTSTLPSSAQTSHDATPVASTSSSASPDNYLSCGSSPPDSALSEQSAKQHLVVLGIPQEGTRTRVETQINVTFALLQTKPNAEGVHPKDLLTAEGDLSEAARQRCRLVTSWNYLKLPAFAAIKRKHKKYIKTDANETNTISLDVKVVKSDSDEQVFICNSCQERERKRAQRKKDPKAKNEAEVEDESGEQVSQDDRRRIVLFNCGQHIDFSNGQATFPARIACYCRHHKEREGFRLSCILRDDAGQVIAETISRPVFTTDDHKARPRNSDVASRNVTSDNLQALAQEQKDYRPQRTSLAGNDSSTSLSNAFSPPTPLAGPSKVEEPSMVGRPASRGNNSKARQMRTEKPYDSVHRPKRRSLGDLHRSQSQLSMTPLETPLPSPHPSSQPSPAHTPHGSGPWDSDMSMQWPFPNTNLESGYVSMADLHQPFNSGLSSNPHSDSGTSPGATGDSASMHSSVTSQEIHDMIVDASPECNPADLSPLSPTQTVSQLPIAQSMPAELSGNDAASELPRIDRVVPDRGPLSGGTEVTILGKNLRQGLVVLFGGTPSYATEIWSSNAMVVIVPPGASPGPVFLAFKDQLQNLNTGIKTYVYVDDMDRRIMEMALQVVGISMNGKHEDATEIAKRIVNRTNSRQGSPTDAWSGSEFLTTEATDSDRVPYATDFEGSILQLLSLLDRPSNEGPSGSRRSLRQPLSLKNDQQHGLLHMAAMLGFHRLTFWCLSRGGDPNITDKYGFTPLHFAALHGRVTVTRLLLQAGAGTYQRTMLGRTALEMALERDQPDVAGLYPSSRPARTVAPPRRVHQSRRSSRSSLFSFFTDGGEGSSEDDDGHFSRRGSRASERGCEADASDEDDDGSDLESRLSRSPSSASLSLPTSSERTQSVQTPGPPKEQVAAAPTQGIHVGDVAGAYHGFLSKISSKMPHPPQLAHTYSLKSPFTVYAPQWAEKLPMPPQFVNVEHMKAWFHSKPSSPSPEPTQSQEGANLATFNPPKGHFWRPFDVLRRESFSTQQPNQTTPDEHVYPPSQTSVEMPLDLTARERLARRLGYIPQDINANVLRAVDYHRSKYSALRRRRVFFVFILPAILLALAWLFYGSNSLSLDAVLRPSSFISTYTPPKQVRPLAG